MGAFCKGVPALKGSYVLIIALDSRVRVKYAGHAACIGPGIYGYVGSARGPGGIRARACRRVSRIRWHVDALILKGRIIGLCWSTRLSEAGLAAAMSALFQEALPGFGNTDTKGPSHLFELRPGWRERLAGLGLSCVS